jgi:hypothetical protein
VLNCDKNLVINSIDRFQKHFPLDSQLGGISNKFTSSSRMVWLAPGTTTIKMPTQAGMRASPLSTSPPPSHITFVLVLYHRQGDPCCKMSLRLPLYVLLEYSIYRKSANFLLPSQDKSKKCWQGRTVFCRKKAAKQGSFCVVGFFFCNKPV